MTQPAGALPLTAQELRCAYDADPFGAEVASDYESLSQDVLHILLETPGSNIDDPDRGIGLEDRIGAATTPQDIAALAALIDRELVKDDRIDASSTTIAPIDTNSPIDAQYQIDIVITVDQVVLPLSFVFGAGGLTAAP